jgi:hypothetical protein
MRGQTRLDKAQVLQGLSRARLAQKNGVLQISRWREILQQMVDVPIDARAAIVAAEVEQVRVQADAVRVGVCHVRPIESIASDIVFVSKNKVKIG